MYVIEISKQNTIINNIYIYQEYFFILETKHGLDSKPSLTTDL